jgi:nitroreductase
MHDLFKKRRSIRRFTSQKPTDEQIKQILSAAMVAPSAKSLHPVEYVVVKDKKKLEKLSACGPHQQFIKEATVAIVIVGDPVKSDQFWLLDATLAAAHIYLETTNQGLATCWTHVFEGKNEKGEERETLVKKALNIPEEKRILCLLPIGYPDEKVSAHREAEYDEDKVHWGGW